jgi:hypothetical protein
MDDIDICPPWWPNWLWWWLHHHPRPKPGEPEPPYLKELREPIESLLLALQTYVGALPSGGRVEAHPLEQMRQMAVDEMHGAVQQLAKTAKAEM